MATDMHAFTVIPTIVHEDIKFNISDNFQIEYRIYFDTVANGTSAVYIITRVYNTLDNNNKIVLSTEKPIDS